MDLFFEFLDKLKTATGNEALIESVRAEYSACFEGWNDKVASIKNGMRTTQLSKSTLDFRYKETLVNAWLVHIAKRNDAFSIAHNGFLYGAVDSNLSHTRTETASSISYERGSLSGKVSFAFPIVHAEDSMFSKRMNDGDIAYGDSAVIFIGTGIQVANRFGGENSGDDRYTTAYMRSVHEDSNNEVLFNKDEPTSCFVLCKDTVSEEHSPYPKRYEDDDDDDVEPVELGHHDNEYWCVHGEKNGQDCVIFRRAASNSAFAECLHWIESHGSEYENCMYHFANHGHTSAKPSIMNRRMTR